MSATLQGYFPIMPTAYRQDGQVDLPSMERLVHFLVENGAQGMSPNGGDSEAAHLAPEERMRSLEAVLAANGGRTPVLAGTTANTAVESLRLNRHAQQAGASAVFVMPSWNCQEMSADAMFAYYQDLAAAIDLPVMVHATRNMDLPFMERLLRHLPTVRYIKEETSHGPRLRQYARELGDRVTVFGPGLHYPAELGWGARGVMPSCCAPRSHARVFDLWQAGRHAEARAEWNLMLPLVFWRWHTAAGEAGKVFLMHRGVFETAFVRPEFGTLKLDQDDRQEMLAILATMDG
jgi:4-hydroxy-tetrahydrodipicolinate synthase